MSSLQETYQKRKIALRKFNDYFNSFTDGHEEEIIAEKTEIRNLIEQIRKFNRHLADDDKLFDEKLFEEFNAQAHKLAQFLKGSSSDIAGKESSQQKMSNGNKQPEPRQSTIEKDPLFSSNFIHLTETNFFDYYPQMMEFIVTDKTIPDERTRIHYLNKTLQTNPKAMELISNEKSMRKAVQILRQHFFIDTIQNREMKVKELIDTFNFSRNRMNDKNNFQQLFQLALHIKFIVRQESRSDYLTMLLKKTPARFHCDSIEDFTKMIKEKLERYNALPSLMDAKYEDLKQLSDRLIVDGQPCPICYRFKKHIRSHPIIDCRYLSEFCKKFGDQMANLSTPNVSSNQSPIDQNTSPPINNNEDNNGFRYYKVNTNNNRRRSGFSADKSLNNKSNELADFFSKQSSTVLMSNNETDRKNGKIIPITLISSNRERLYQMNASINDANNAMIEIDYLKSLKIDAKIQYETVSDLKKLNSIVGHVEIEIAIGFLIRTVKFWVFSSLKETPNISLSTDIIKQFLLKSSFGFEQRFANIIDCSIQNANGKAKRKILLPGSLDLHVNHLDDDVVDEEAETNEHGDEPKNGTLRKLLAANFIIKSLPDTNNESLRISFIDSDDRNDYFVDQGNQIYYDLNVAIEDRSLKQLTYKKAHIYLLMGEEKECDKNYMDSMLIKFDQKKFFIIIQLPHSSEQDGQIHKIINECRELLS